MIDCFVKSLCTSIRVIFYLITIHVKKVINNPAISEVINFIIYINEFWLKCSIIYNVVIGCLNIIMYIHLFLSKSTDELSSLKLSK